MFVSNSFLEMLNEYEFSEMLRLMTSRVLARITHAVKKASTWLYCIHNRRACLRWHSYNETIDFGRKMSCAKATP